MYFCCSNYVLFKKKIEFIVKNLEKEIYYFWKLSFLFYLFSVLDVFGNKFIEKKNLNL